MFWGAIQSDGRKKLVRSSKKLNAVSYLGILYNYTEKYKSKDLIFDQDKTPVHKWKSVGLRKGRKGTGMGGM